MQVTIHTKCYHPCHLNLPAPISSIMPMCTQIGDPVSQTPSMGPVQCYEPAGEQEQEQQRSGRYVVRSCLGGYNQAFVLSGSEESKVGSLLCHPQKNKNHHVMQR